MNGKVGFDLDGVLYDWHGVVYEWMQDSHKGVENVNYADFWNNWLPQQNDTLQGFLMKTPIFYTKKIMPDSVRNVLWDLANSGQELFYITSRALDVRFATKWWLESSRIPHTDNLIFATESKVPYVVDHNIEFFIEDMTKHALELRNVTNVILKAQPWNEIIQPEFTTVQSILEIPEVLLGVTA